MQELGKLALTTNDTIVAKLERKLTEYNRRNAYIPPEYDFHETYKMEILRALLQKGCIDPVQLKEEFAARYGVYHEPAFVDAWGVIGAYNANALKELKGSSGFN